MDKGLVLWRANDRKHATLHIVRNHRIYLDFYLLLKIIEVISSNGIRVNHIINHIAWEFELPTPGVDSNSRLPLYYGDPYTRGEIEPR